MCWTNAAFDAGLNTGLCLVLAGTPKHDRDRRIMHLVQLLKRRTPSRKDRLMANDSGITSFVLPYPLNERQVFYTHNPRGPTHYTADGVEANSRNACLVPRPIQILMLLLEYMDNIQIVLIAAKH